MSERARDIGLVVAVAAAMTLMISVATEDTAQRSADVLAYALGLALAALLFARRRQPMLVLVGSVGVVMVYLALGYAAFLPAVPLAPAAYSAAAAGRTLPAAVLLAGFELFGAGWQTLGEGESVFSVLGTVTVTDASLMAAMLALGEAVRHRRAWTQEVRARAVEEERLRIARELHDVLAHTIAGLNVQAGVAADVVDDSPEEAKAALRAIREQSRTAVTELQATLGLLRAEDAPRAPAPRLDALDELVQQAAAAGVNVELAISGTPRPLPGAVNLTAYRIVQESLTNVVRHAGAATATVAVRYEPQEVVVEVRDDGRGAVNGSGGFGQLGMRERASALGGRLEAGPAPEGGYRVRAELPT